MYEKFPLRIYLSLLFFVLYSIACFLAFRMHFLDDYIQGAMLEVLFASAQGIFGFVFILLSKPFLYGEYSGVTRVAWVLFIFIFLSLGAPVMGLARYYDFADAQMSQQLEETRSSLIEEELALSDEKRIAGKELTFLSFENYLGLVVEEDGNHAEVEGSLEDVTDWYQNYFEENGYEVKKSQGGSSTLIENTGELRVTKGYYLTMENGEFIIQLSLSEKSNIVKLSLR